MYMHTFLRGVSGIMQGVSYYMGLLFYYKRTGLPEPQMSNKP